LTPTCWVGSSGQAGEVVRGATAGRTESEIREVSASLDLLPLAELLVWWGYH
jgi:hypothetical protein